MTIAELFVNLGVKGADSAGKALKGVKGGLGDVKSMSLEAKAAILGVVYGLQRMMSASAQQGTDLSNFASLTGLSTKVLQQYQYAGQQVGITNEEVAGSFKQVQNAMMQTLTGQGAPSGLARVAELTGGITREQAKDTELMMRKLQEYALKEQNQALGNQNLKSFGLSEGVIAGMRRNAFNEDIMKKAPSYTDAQIKSLDKVNAAWANLGGQIKKAFGDFTAKDGLKIVREISMITTEVIKMAKAFMQLADSLQLFKGISKIFEGWGMIFKGITEGVDTVKDAATGSDKKKTAAQDRLKEWGETFMDIFKGMEIVGKEQTYGKDYETGIKNKVLPSVRSGDSSKKDQNIHINQNLNFQHDGKDSKKTGDSVKKAVQGAALQMFTQTQVT